MRLRVVATLGSDSRRFLAAMSLDLAADWAPARNPAPVAVRTKLGGQDTAAVALLHPSGYHGSLGCRHYGEFTGLDAEAALLREALADRG